jgi:hypothetical protein
MDAEKARPLVMAVFPRALEFVYTQVTPHDAVELRVLAMRASGEG